MSGIWSASPSKKNHAEQIKLVSSFDWVDFGALSGIGALIRETMSGEQAVDFVGTDRVDAIVETAEKRVRHLQEMVLAQRPADLTDSVEGDVEENIAEDYGPKMTI